MGADLHEHHSGAGSFVAGAGSGVMVAGGADPEITDLLVSAWTGGSHRGATGAEGSASTGSGTGSETWNGVGSGTRSGVASEAGSGSEVGHAGVGSGAGVDGEVAGGAGERDLCARGVEVSAWARRLAAVEPGPGLAMLLHFLPAEVLSDDEVVEVVAASRRLAGWVHAQTTAWAAELAHRPSMRPTGSPSTRMQDGCVAADELAMRLAESRQSTAGLVAEGVAFEGLLAPTGEALRAGRIDARRARVMVERLRGVDGEVAWTAQERVLPIAGRRSVSQVRRDVDRVLAEVDGAHAVDRHRQARRTRKVTRPVGLPDGMAAMWWVLPAVDAARVDGVLDCAARTARSAGDPRTLDQLRADGLRDLTLGLPDWAVDLCRQGLLGDPEDRAGTARGSRSGNRADREARPGREDWRGKHDRADADDRAETGHQRLVLGDRTGSSTGASGHAVAPTVSGDHPASPAGLSGHPASPTGSSERPEAPAGPTGPGACTRPHARAAVHVTVPLTTLLGLDDGPADLHGYGAIDADQARDLAFNAGSRWRRIITDPLTGAVLDVGRTTYTPPAPIARHVRVRDRRCARPGCDVPAERCDLDHTIEYHGPPATEPGTPTPPPGTTSTGNLGPLCPHDHRLKSGAGFVLRQTSPGVFDWLTPTGHRYRTRPGTDQPPEHLTTHAHPPGHRTLDPRGRALTQAELDARDGPPPF